MLPCIIQPFIIFILCAQPITGAGRWRNVGMGGGERGEGTLKSGSSNYKTIFEKNFFFFFFFFRLVARIALVPQ